MGTLSERLTSRGWRMTAQRRVIAGVFDGASGHASTVINSAVINRSAVNSSTTDRTITDRHDDIHLTADEVHERAVLVLPEISRATVYNTLGEMVDVGELLAVHVGDRITRYDPNVHESHHHLVCSMCGSIQDVPAAAVPPAPAGFLVESADVIYRGRCADCAAN